MLQGSSALIRFLLACVMLGMAIGFPRLAGAAEQKIALVIGNSAYPPAARLRNPVNDATAMATKLRSLGFEVILKTDASQREMTRAISQFGQKLALGSVSLFYYAGHGMQVRGKNFLIPVDAEIENEASVRSEGVDVDQVLDQLGPARLSMVILDACRNNPFERRFRGTGGGLAQIDAPTGTVLAYATAPDKVAADGTGSNGLYTTELLKALDTPGLRVEDVFKQVRIGVIKASNNQQIPWESSSLTGEFFFRPDLRPAADNEKLRQAVQTQTELQKALDEERQKRDRDAELVRAEMEKLRAELLKLREDSVPSRPAVQASAPSSATPTVAAPKPAGSPPEQRPQVALAPPSAGPAAAPPPTLASAPSSAPPTVTAPKPTSSPSEQPTQVAIASPTAGPASAPSFAAEWAPRIALLEKSHGQLTLSKAVAILLDMNSAEELSLLLTHEGAMKRLQWQSAYAVGVDKNGSLIWGGGRLWRVPSHALETALQYCARSADSSCKIVMVNGEIGRASCRERV